MIWRVPTAGVKKVELMFKDCCQADYKAAQISDLKIHYSIVWKLIFKYMEC